MKNIISLLTVIGLYACGGGNDDTVLLDTARGGEIFLLEGGAAQELYLALDVAGARKGFDSVKTIDGFNFSCVEKLNGTLPTYGCGASQLDLLGPDNKLKPLFVLESGSAKALYEAMTIPGTRRGAQNVKAEDRKINVTCVKKNRGASTTFLCNGIASEAN